MTQSELEFWKAVYVAAVRGGDKYPALAADRAVRDLRREKL